MNSGTKTESLDSGTEANTGGRIGAENSVRGAKSRSQERHAGADSGGHAGVDTECLLLCLLFLAEVIESIISAGCSGLKAGADLHRGGDGSFINLTNGEGGTTQPQYMVNILSKRTCGICCMHLIQKMVTESKPEESIQRAIAPGHKMREFDELLYILLYWAAILSMCIE